MPSGIPHGMRLHDSFKQTRELQYMQENARRDVDEKQ